MTMDNKNRKAIAYAFPTSARASELGFAASGCYYVQTEALADGRWYDDTHPGTEGFTDAFDADLVALYHETPGVMCPHFKTHGRQDIVKNLLTNCI
jgi:tricorn protease-like protein